MRKLRILKYEEFLVNSVAQKTLLEYVRQCLLFYPLQDIYGSELLNFTFFLLLENGSPLVENKYDGRFCYKSFSSLKRSANAQLTGSAVIIQSVGVLHHCKQWFSRLFLFPVPHSFPAFVVSSLRQRAGLRSVLCA